MTVTAIEAEEAKMTEIGLLPHDWKVVRLGDVARVTSGGSAPQGKEFFGGQNPFVRVQHLELESNSIRRWDLITDDAVNKCRLKLYLKGTIVFPKSGASVYLEKRAVLPIDAYIVSHLCAVTSNAPLIDQDFLFCFLRFVRLAEQKAEGYPTLNLTEIKERRIACPPLPEQRRIAHVLSSVQTAIEKTEAVITATKEFKKSLLKHLFTYGLMSTGESEGMPLKETEIGLVPERWKMVKFGEIAEFKNGINFAREQKGSGVLTVDVLNMYTDGLNLQMKGLYRVNLYLNNEYLLLPGDILFVRSSLKQEGVGWATLFSGHEEPATFCGFLIRARLTSKAAYPPFLTAYFRMPSVRNLLVSKSGKVAITNINQANLKSAPVFLPLFPVQKKIADMLSNVDRKLEAEENTKKALEALFQTLLKNLMTGKIRINNLEVPV